MKKLFSLAMALVLALSLAACGQDSGSGKSADLPKVLETMKSEVGFSDVIELDEAGLKSNYGIEADDVKQFAAKIKSTGTEYDQVLLFEGIDTDKANNIKKALDTWYEYEKSQTVSYLPEQYAIIEKCSVKQQGNYVSLIVSEQADKINGIYEESFQ